MKTGPRPQEWHHRRQVCGGGFEPAPTDYRHLLARLSAVRIHGPRDPSSCRGWMRLSCGPAFQRAVRATGAATTKVDVPRRSLPSPHPQARSPILGGSEGRFKATAGNCLPPRCNLTRGRRARRGNGIGNASCGCPVCTVLGGATYSVVKVLLRLVGADARGCVTISAASIRRASSAGAPIRGDVPRVPRHCPFG